MEQVKNPQEVICKSFKKYIGKYLTFYPKDKEERSYGIAYIRDVQIKGVNKEVFILENFYNNKGVLSYKGRWNKLSSFNFSNLNFFALTKKEFKKELIIRNLK